MKKRMSESRQLAGSIAVFGNPQSNSNSPMNDWLPQFVKHLSPSCKSEGVRDIYIRDFILAFALKPQHCIVEIAEKWSLENRGVPYFPSSVYTELAKDVGGSKVWDRKRPLYWTMDWVHVCSISSLPHPESRAGPLISNIEEWDNDNIEMDRQWNSLRLYFVSLIVRIAGVNWHGSQSSIINLQTEFEKYIPKNVANYVKPERVFARANYHEYKRRLNEKYRKKVSTSVKRKKYLETHLDSAEDANVQRYLREISEFKRGGQNQFYLKSEIGSDDIYPEKEIDYKEGDAKSDPEENIAIPEIESVPVEPATETKDGEVLPVWFATTRNRLHRENAIHGFGVKRSEITSMGKVEVFIPKAHRFGELGSWLLKRVFRGDDRLKIRSVLILEDEQFWSQIRRYASFSNSDGNSEALVYIHGYNVSFEQAALRAAQLGRDLAISGPTAFFSWPSKGSPLSYPADEATIESSEPRLRQFLWNFVKKSGVAKVHIIAHSMGNRGLLRSLQHIASSAETEADVKFAQVILAAPDVDRDVFLELVKSFRGRCDRITLYSSRRDFALLGSTILHQFDRAGYYKPYTFASGMDTVAVPNFDVDTLGHSYYAQAEALLHDIYELIKYGTVPPRQRLSKQDIDGNQLWRIIK